MIRTRPFNRNAGKGEDIRREINKIVDTFIDENKFSLCTPGRECRELKEFKNILIISRPHFGTILDPNHCTLSSFLAFEKKEKGPRQMNSIEGEEGSEQHTALTELGVKCVCNIYGKSFLLDVKL